MVLNMLKFAIPLTPIRTSAIPYLYKLFIYLFIFEGWGQFLETCMNIDSYGEVKHTSGSTAGIKPFAILYSSNLTCLRYMNWMKVFREHIVF